MKFLKLFALVSITWTTAEIVTQWRLHPEPISFVNYLKFYYEQCGEEVARAYDIADGKSVPDGTKAAASYLAFPHREQ